MTEFSAQDLCDALLPSIPMGRWEPITATLCRAYYGTIFIPDWPAHIELDIEFIEKSPHKAIVDEALALLAKCEGVSIEGAPRDWLSARVFKDGVPAAADRPERMLSDEETEQANTLLYDLFQAFANMPKPTPFTDLSCSYMPLESHAFERIDWETADYALFCLVHEGWICAPLATQLWLFPRLLRILLLRRDHPAVDNISIDLEGLLGEWEIITSILTPRQSGTLQKAMHFYERLFL